MPARLAGTGAGSGFVTITMDPPAVRVARDFDEMHDRATNLRFVFARVRDQVIIPQIRSNFASHGQGSWAPLAAYTIWDRARRGYGPTPILQRRGLGGGLLQSATAKVIWRVDNQGIEYTGLRSNQYGESHHVGYMGPYGPVPARPWLYITQSNINDIQETIANYIVTGN